MSNCTDSGLPTLEYVSLVKNWKVVKLWYLIRQWSLDACNQTTSWISNRWGEVTENSRLCFCTSSLLSVTSSQSVWPKFYFCSVMMSWKPLGVLRSIEMTQKMLSIPGWIVSPIKNIHPIELSAFWPSASWSLRCLITLCAIRGQVTLFLKCRLCESHVAA